MRCVNLQGTVKTDYYIYFKEKFREIIKKKDSMITFTIEADYVKDHSPKDLCHSCFHAAYIEIPPG